MRRRSCGSLHSDSNFGGPAFAFIRVAAVGLPQIRASTEMSSVSRAIPRLADEQRRAILLAMPEHGRVTRLKNRIVIDFSPALRGSDRYLWAFAGKAFETTEAAESVRQRICIRSTAIPLVDAVAEFRGSRSRNHRVADVIDRFLEAARTTPSDRTGTLLSPRTLAAYKAVLRRSKPFWTGMTISEACQADTLRRWKGWFRLPVNQGGRGLASDQEARNAFAAFRAVVAWYRTTRPDFPPPNWPSMPTASTAKRRNVARRRVENRLTLPEVVRGIDAIPEARQPLFWVLFYTQARPAEVRGVLGEDWARPKLTIRRSAATRHSGAEIRPTTKTGETGTYELPEWVCDLIDRHCTGARFDPSKPLFANPDPRAGGPLFSDDAIRDTWIAATKHAQIPWAPVYRAFKHTQVSALRDAGISIEDIIDQCRWTSASMLDHYDERKDERRGSVVARLDEMVGKARSADIGLTQKLTSKIRS